MERAPVVSAGNKGNGNKCREEKRLRGFSFIPAPCALNSNLLIPSCCSVLRDLIISDFPFLPGWLSVRFASLSHVVVSYFCSLALVLIYAAHILEVPLFLMKRAPFLWQLVCNVSL